MIAIERIVGPEPLGPLAPLWDRALNSGIWVPGPFARIRADLEKATLDPYFIVLAGRFCGETSGLAVGVLPSSTLHEWPQVPFFYSEGPRQLTLALATAVVDQFREAGYTRFRAINRSGAPDEVWARALKPGGRMRPLGSYVEFDNG